MKLDAKSVAALKLDGKTDAIWFDEQLAGFGYRLRLGSGGQLRRSWIVQYRRAGGTRRVLLGSADVLSAAQARPAAQKILAQVALGEDPQADKASRRSADKLTLRSVIDEFLAVKETEVRPKTHGELKRYLAEGPYFRALHGMPIDTVTRKDVAAQLLAMTRRHGAATAALARGALSGFFAWAMTQGLAESNPVTGTAKLKTAPPRERVLSDDELARIWGACKDPGRLRHHRQVADRDRLPSRRGRRHVLGRDQPRSRHLDDSRQQDQERPRAQPAAHAIDARRHRRRAAPGDARSVIWRAREWLHRLG